MPTIGAVVKAETKAKFKLVAHQRVLTPSCLAATLIEEFLAQQEGENFTTNSAMMPLPFAVARGESRTEKVSVRLEPYYYAELGRLACERKWFRGTYLANLFLAHADRRPVLSEVEVDAVRQVARQLADMGRNINQIAKKLNGSLENAHLTLSVDLELIKMLIDLESRAVQDLIKANLRGWGVQDGEA